MANVIRNLLIKYGVDLSQYNTAIADLKKKQTGVETSFRESSNAMENWRGKSEGLALRVNTLNEKIKLQKQILDNLNAELAETKRVTGENSDETQAMQRSYNAASRDLDKMEKELSDTRGELGRVATAEGKSAAEIKKMGGEMKTAETKTKSLKQNLKEFAQSSVGQFTTLAGAAAAVWQGLKKLWDVVAEAAKAADELITLSNKTGIAVDELQRMEYAARFIDVEVETMTSSMIKLTKAMDNARIGTKEQVEAFKMLGIEYKNSDGSLRNAKDVWAEAIDALGQMSNEANRDALALRLFGRSAADLNPLIKAGGKALKQYGDEAEDMGAVIDRGAVAKLGRLDDKLQQTAAIMQAEGRRMAAAVAPVVDALATAWNEVVKFTSQNETLVRNMQMLLGVTEAEARKSVDAYNRVAEAFNVLGGDADVFRAKYEELFAMYRDQGMPAMEAFNQALETLAQGLDKTAIETQRVAEEQTRLQEVVDATLADFRATQDEYYKALDTRTKLYLEQMGGLFGEFPAKLKQSKKAIQNERKDILKELQIQVDGWKTWSDELQKLAKRGIDEGVIKELRDMGPKALPQVQAINSMSTKEFDKFKTLSAEKFKLAKDAAVDELKPLAADVDKKLVAVENAIKARDESMKGSGKKVGSAVADGIKDGIHSGTPAIKRQAESSVLQALNATKKKLGISSPSTVFRDEVGKQMGAGIGVGFLASMKDVDKNATRSVGDMVKSLSGLGANVPLSIHPQLSAVSAGPAAKDNPHNNMNFKFYLDGRELTARIVPYVDEGLQTRKTAYGRGGGIR